MDLRSISNNASNVINGNITVQVQTSGGFTMDTGPGHRQVPAYNEPVTGPAQVQALDNSELKLIDGLNLQADVKAIYFKGRLAGVVRPDSKGGDLVIFPDKSTWLVVKVLESWRSWTKAVIVKQVNL